MKSLIAVVGFAAIILFAVACRDGGQAATPAPASTTTTATPAPSSTATPSATGATGDEEFFNVEFSRNIVAVSIGAFLGFGGAWLVGQYFTWRRQIRIAKAARNAIATESIYNLITLTNIEKRTRMTLDSDFSTRSYHEFRPRTRLAQQLMTPDVLIAISHGELAALVVTVPELEHLAASYSEWVNTIASENRPMAQEKTRILLHLIRVFGMNVLGLLIAICHRRDLHLLDENARRIAMKLSRVRVARPPDFTKCLRSSHLKDAPNREQIVKEKRFLVVWEHDWPECPMEVIELQQCVDPKVIRYSE